jgi:uncharacterized damage-inducible protein DinB
MLVNVLKTLLHRDLTKLKLEISLYRNEQNLWRVEQDVTNSSGNLCLHIIGNLNTYIGATLGNSGYVRNREEEFSLKDIPQKELIAKIEETILVVGSVLHTLTDEKFTEEYPIVVFAEKTSIGFFLVHLATHLTYHLGQVNYHRRLLDVNKA